MSHTSPTVVVTGIGVVSPIGIDWETFSRSIVEGKSGIRVVEEQGFLASPKNVGGYVTEFDDKAAKKLLPKSLRKNAKVMCREIQHGVVSAVAALEHAGLSPADEGRPVDSRRLGVEFGANLMLSPPSVLYDACLMCVDKEDPEHVFHHDRWGDGGLRGLEPLWLLKYLPNMPACHITIAADARGPSNSLTQEEASAGLALGEAIRSIHRGVADAMIVGTTGTRLHSVKTVHAALWDHLADSTSDPSTWCRPFSKDRIGDVISEGSASLILETEEHATGRGAKIYAKILGTGASCVADRTGKTDKATALEQAMHAALRAADVSAEDIGSINAHASGAIETDAAEAEAIHRVFGGQAQTIPVTALKSVLGNSGSGSGMLEIAGTIAAAANDVIPTTLNFAGSDESHPLNVVHGGAIPLENRLVMKTSVTRMGQAAAVVLECA